jgi:hypothetical protein
VSTFREPVIGDELDLETYGRPSTQRAAYNDAALRSEAAPRAHASYERAAYADRSAARARRVNTHRPRPVEATTSRRRIEPLEDERSRYSADGVRTVKISGQATPPRRRSAQRSLAVQIDRYDRRPDRAAQWALFMGVFMIVVAIVTGT